MPSKRLRQLGGMAVLGTVLSCSNVATTQSNRVSPSISALIVVPDATNIVPTRDYDGAVKYELSESFPAEKTIEFISEKLQEQGWTPLTTDFLNPGSETSQVKGWVNIIMGKEMVFSWMGQWRNKNGDIVLYGLNYRVPAAETRASGPLYVQAVFFSSATARKLMSQPRP